MWKTFQVYATDDNGYGAIIFEAESAELRDNNHVLAISPEHAIEFTLHNEDGWHHLSEVLK